MNIWIKVTVKHPTKFFKTSFVEVDPTVENAGLQILHAVTGVWSTFWGLTAFEEDCVNDGFLLCPLALNKPYENDEPTQEDQDRHSWED